MATATGGDLVVRMLSELRELQQQFVASGERVQEQFGTVEAQFHALQEQMRVTQEQMHVLARVVREGHERTQGHFTRLIAMAGQLAEDRELMLRRLDEHDARLDALERRGR